MAFSDVLAEAQPLRHLGDTRFEYGMGRLLGEGPSERADFRAQALYVGACAAGIVACTLALTASVFFGPAPSRASSSFFLRARSIAAWMIARFFASASSVGVDVTAWGAGSFAGSAGFAV